IYQQCWIENPDRRPSAKQIHDQLNKDTIITRTVFKGEEEKCCSRHPHALGITKFYNP
ncbi:1089_t:CDS:1, partial [Acaulospora morrowiae]